jgi:uncharacterized protein (DUF58 family)
MDAGGEFHYKLGSRIGGHRPGSHPGLALGTGQEFAAHGRLLDSPDPRRIDVHASLRTTRREWLVRNYRQRAAVSVHAIVDVSASMRFGAERTKLDVAADFAEGLGLSAFRAGDSAGLRAFDTRERSDLHVPARYSRGIGAVMAEQLRQSGVRQGSDAGGGSATALLETIADLTGKSGLVFLVSDFHWPLAGLPAVLDALARSNVVPVVTWDPAETTPPRRNGLLELIDAESGAARSLWVGARTRSRWHEGVARRRAAIEALFAGRELRPFYMSGVFSPEHLTRYFLEEQA